MGLRDLHFNQVSQEILNCVFHEDLYLRSAGLEQGLTNHSLHPLFFVDKVLLEHSQPHLLMNGLWLLLLYGSRVE